MISPDVAETLIGCRLMILQSKRLMLNSARRRLERTDMDELRQRVEELRAEIDHAQHAYRQTMLGYGSPDRPEYWLVAYGRLIVARSALVGKLRLAVDDLPAVERYRVSTDVEVLEAIIDQWGRSMRASMAEAV